MSARGYFGLACYRPKTVQNWGSLYRTADIMGAAFIATIGERFRRQASDVLNTWKRVPVFCYPDWDAFAAARPFDCLLVGVELSEQARPLATYSHPERAIYLLGAEDDGLPPKVLAQCQQIVQLPGTRSMNVACAGSVVLTHRVMQRDARGAGEPYIAPLRDVPGLRMGERAIVDAEGRILGAGQLRSE